MQRPQQVHEDRGLIRYLMRHHHTTPFEMCEVKLHVRVPMDCWRQWIRHRTANVNEYSTRYSIAIDSVQRTPANEWRKQAKGNRQGSLGIGPSVGLDSLLPGWHTITLTVVDTHGAPAESSVKILIGYRNFLPLIGR